MQVTVANRMMKCKAG